MPTPTRLTRAVAETEKLWNEGQTIKVSLMNADLFQNEKVRQYVAAWEEHANIHFKFVDWFADIKVGFAPGASWSMIGTDAKEVSGQTMNLGWIREDVDEEQIRSVILHEFGHALGLIHEHQNPKVEIPWDLEAVYEWAAGPPNYWDRATVDVNMLDAIDAERVIATKFDPESIMLYAIPGELTGGRMVTEWNSNLSERDKTFIAQLYSRS